MVEFAKHGVYINVIVEECLSKTGAEPIGTRWVDINKGDKVHPEYRSRLVAQEIKGGQEGGLICGDPAPGG